MPGLKQEPPESRRRDNARVAAPIILPLPAAVPAGWALRPRSNSSSVAALDHPTISSTSALVPESRSAGPYPARLVHFDIFLDNEQFLAQISGEINMSAISHNATTGFCRYRDQP
jgi:hypothetical protein